jgi:hypothetical protein
MEEKRRYSNQQSNSAFQPQIYRQSGFEQVNPGRTETHSSSDPGNGNKNRDSIHKIQAGDTLWGIAEAKLGNGSRWTELQKKDGSAFTNQEAHHLRVGTEIYLSNIELANGSLHIPASQMQIGDLKTNPNAMNLEIGTSGDRSVTSPGTHSNSFIQPKSGSFSGADLIKSVQSNPEGVSHREFAGGDRPVAFPGVRTLPATYQTLPATYETSQASSPQFRTGSGSLRDRANGIPLAQESTQPGSGSDNSHPLGLSDNEYLAQRIVGDAAAGYLVGDVVRNRTRSNPTLPDAWAAKQGLQPWSTEWTSNGRNQFRIDMNEILTRKLGANPDGPLREFAEEVLDKEGEKTGKWKLKKEYQGGHMGGVSSGTREMFALESQHRNGGEGARRTIKDPQSGDEIRVNDKEMKGKGGFLRKRAISIDGIPVEIQTARDLEEAGKLPKGTVENARLHPGWARTQAISDSEVDRITRKRLQEELTALEKLEKAQPGSQNQGRIKELKNLKKHDWDGVTDDHLSLRDRTAIDRLRDIAIRPENALGGGWRGTKVTERSVDLVRDQLIRRGLKNNKKLSLIDRLKLNVKLTAGKVTDADLARVDPGGKARVDKLRGIVEHDRTIRESIQSELRKNSQLSQTDLRDLQRKLMAGKATDADLGKLSPASKKQIKQLIDQSNKQLRKELKDVYAVYDEALRESVKHSVNHTVFHTVFHRKKPARGRAVVDKRDVLPPSQREGRHSTGASDTSNRTRSGRRTSPRGTSAPPPTDSHPGNRRPAPPRSTSPETRLERPRTTTPRADSLAVRAGGNHPRLPEVHTGEKFPKIPAGLKKGAKGLARGAGKVFKPLGFAMDAYDLGSAMYKDGGIGENTKKVAKEGAISWGSAAAGAGIGAAVAGPPGALVGGIVGGLAPVAVEYGPKAAKKVGSWVKSWFD